MNASQAALRARKGAALSVLAAALALAGCASTGDIHSQSTVRDAGSFGLAAGTGAAFQPSAQWWHDFGDAQLDELIALALQGNPSLKVAQARLVRAQAAAEAAGAAKLPQVNGQLDVTRQRFSENSLYPPPLAGGKYNMGTLQLTGGWELDFFGKNEAALQTALGAQRAAQADAEAARILLAGNVARAYLQLARVNDQLEVARLALRQRNEALALVRDRVNAGLDTQLELRQSEGALPEARQQVEALQEQAQLAQHAIAALTGQGNRDVVKVQPSLARLKPIPLPGDLRADLLAQRADIAAARYRVEAAGYDVKNAKALFYPNISITSFLGLSSIGLGKLLDAGSLQWGVGPAIHLPIFEGGKLRANLRGKTAELDVAIESYNGAVLDAIHDAADQVSSAQSVARQQAEQRDAQAAAEAAYQIALQRYRAGLGTYLNVLSAETSVLAQRRLAVDLAGRALETQVGLVRAFGGGYTAPAPATTASR